ncbi:MAG TPA: hypothetical protein DDY04_02650, partial [Bacteroidales bacterium]|nr:hypothetical protein [Bacteroidales bacterium]
QIPDSRFKNSVLLSTINHQPSTIFPNNEQLLYNFQLFFLGLYYLIMRDYQPSTINISAHRLTIGIKKKEVN